MGLGIDSSRSAPERVRAALAAAGIETPILSFEVSTRTAAEAAEAVRADVGQIVKSLMFTAGDEPVLALVSGANRLDPGKLAARVGHPIGKADASFVRQASGYAIGGVPPLGFPAPIPTYIDRDLLRYELVWAAAGTPHHVFSIPPHDLVRLTKGIVADLRAL
jgi:prolyl-tRNA editing enzyme YbaK/EbsC (Cys-tRNA(Pro) deacylase)